MDGFNFFKATKPLRGDNLLFTTSPQEVLVLIWSTTEGRKAEWNLEPHNGLEQVTPGLGIQLPVISCCWPDQAIYVLPSFVSKFYCVLGMNIRVVFSESKIQRMAKKFQFNCPLFLVLKSTFLNSKHICQSPL